MGIGYFSALQRAVRLFQKEIICQGGSPLMIVIAAQDDWWLLSQTNLGSVL